MRILVWLALLATAASAQQKVEFSGGIPVAPKGLADKPLPKLPVEIDTAEGMRVRVTAVTTDLEWPFAMAFLPDNTILVTQRNGQMRSIRGGKLDAAPVAGVPQSYFAGESGLPGAVHGLMDVVLHPNFAQNRWIYFTYTKPHDANRRSAVIARGRWDGKGLTEVKDLFDTGTAGPLRLAFDRQGLLYTATSGNNPQDAATLGGKTLRLRDDGTPAPGNPFANNGRPEVYTIGHRNTLGLAMHPGTGEIWSNENGPNGGDEINILKAGANYGWPIVSYGRTYTGPWQVNAPNHVNFEAPVIYWMPAIAVSGMAFYTGDRFPKWKGDIFVASLRTGEIPGTGHIERILINERMEELRRESLLTEFHQRMRDIRQGPDGLLYVLTDQKQGALLRLEPVQ